jgi:hypothetical protein
MSSAFPPAAMAARAHLKIGSDHPKGKMDVRFWRKGFDSTGEPEFQYGDYGRRAVKIRFRASQWPSPTMKLHRWLREVSRTNSTFLKALPFLLPLTYSAFFEDGRVALAHVVGTMSALWVRRVALAMLITVLPAYMRKLTPKRLVIVIMSLLAIISSRRWFPDHAQLPLYTTALLSLGGLLVLLVSFHIEYVFPQSFAGVKVKTILKDGVRVEPTEALALSWHIKIDGHEKSLLKDLYPNANIPDPMESTIEFGVYKGMSTKDLRALLRTRFWMFNLNSSWPAWVKSPPPGGQFFPLEAITLNPENFRARRDDVAHDEGYLDTDDDLAEGADPDGDVWILPPSQVTPLRLPGIHLAVPRRVCRSYWKRWWAFAESTASGMSALFHGTFAFVEQSVAFLSKGWFIVFLMATFASQMIAPIRDDVSGTLGENVARVGQSWAGEAVQLVRAPLLYMYRHGPVVSTALGEFGGWAGKSAGEICKEMLRTDQDIGAAGRDFCDGVVREREDRFVNTVLCAAGAWMVWQYVFRRK